MMQTHQKHIETIKLLIYKSRRSDERQRYPTIYWETAITWKLVYYRNQPQKQFMAATNCERWGVIESEASARSRCHAPVSMPLS